MGLIEVYANTHKYYFFFLGILERLTFRPRDHPLPLTLSNGLLPLDQPLIFAALTNPFIICTNGISCFCFFPLRYFDGVIPSRVKHYLHQVSF